VRRAVNRIPVLFEFLMLKWSAFYMMNLSAILDQMMIWSYGMVRPTVRPNEFITGVHSSVSDRAAP